MNKLITRDEIVSFVKDSEIDVATSSDVTDQRVGTIQDLLTLMDTSESRPNDTVGDTYIIRQGNTDIAFILTRIDVDEPRFTGVLILQKDDSGRLKMIQSVYLHEHRRIAGIVAHLTKGGDVR